MDTISSIFELSDTLNLMQLPLFDMQDERIIESSGQENEDDLIIKDEKIFSEAVLWGTDWTTETVLSQLQRGNIELNPTYQRRDAWNIERKSKFIESLFLGLPIPQIILAERKDKKGAYIVIDGKQRLLSIRQFCAQSNDPQFNQITLKGLGILSQLNNRSYQSMIEEGTLTDYLSAFENQQIRTTVIRNWPNQDFLYTVFLRLNTGSLPLSPQELRQALNPGGFTDFADSYSQESEPIKKALGLTRPDFRMRDVEMVVRYYAFRYFLETYNGNLKKFLDDTCKSLNSSWESSTEQIIGAAHLLDSAIDLTMNIFGVHDAFSKWISNRYQRKFNRPVFDIMTYYFSKEEIYRSITEEMYSTIRESFEQLCSRDNDFLRSLETTTKNTVNTTYRLEQWGLRLQQIIGIPITIPNLGSDNTISLRVYG